MWIIYTCTIFSDIFKICLYFNISTLCLVGFFVVAIDVRAVHVDARLFRVFFCTKCDDAVVNYPVSLWVDAFLVLMLMFDFTSSLCASLACAQSLGLVYLTMSEVSSRPSLPFLYVHRRPLYYWWCYLLRPLSHWLLRLHRCLCTLLCFFPRFVHRLVRRWRLRCYCSSSLYRRPRCSHRLICHLRFRCFSCWGLCLRCIWRLRHCWCCYAQQ